MTLPEAHSYVLHKHRGSEKSSDALWHPGTTGSQWRSNLEKSNQLAVAKKPVLEEEDLNNEVLGNGDSDTVRDSEEAVGARSLSRSPAFEVAEAKVMVGAADSLIAVEGAEGSSSAKETPSVADKLDRLIREIDEENRKEKEANQVDNSFQQAEAIKAKLDFEINRTRLILMRLRSLQRNIADATFLAKKLVESGVVSKNIKDVALNNLDKSVEKVKKVLVKM